VFCPETLRGLPTPDVEYKTPDKVDGIRVVDARSTAEKKKVLQTKMCAGAAQTPRTQSWLFLKYRDR
jgi:uncharacterized protein YbbK (DUF523 family)